MGVPACELSMETVYKEYAPWDSLMMLQLVMELEQEYGVSIPMERLNKIRTLQDLYRIVA